MPSKFVLLDLKAKISDADVILTTNYIQNIMQIENEMINIKLRFTIYYIKYKNI